MRENTTSPRGPIPHARRLDVPQSTATQSASVVTRPSPAELKSVYRASVQLSENASALVLNGLPSRSRFHGLPAAWMPLRDRRAPRAGTSTVHTPYGRPGTALGCV